jgi:hypothetical protein
MTKTKTKKNLRRGGVPGRGPVPADPAATK